MLFRLIDPRDGRPRDPVFWLVAAALAGAQLLALFALCSSQVRQADERRGTVVLAAQPAALQCQIPTGEDCAVFYGPGPGGHPVELAVR
ncbi:hypothetical protein PE066_08070 [Ramlibacter tataouinensis]|uniref:hypothetical protein n=1 Tax=Ramlibacter tataouinensis TaxID=94132 RepID=UPI0022F3E520|nr:hypothetical protein [Ramlibacter tataouinensis]WBY03477.1 hypothetical protein PE066_08070 [Ramlibacter tataouinensis]